MNITTNESQTRLGENVGIVFGAYLFGFVPLGLIYALDYITRDYKTIRKTRYHGYLTFLVSIPSTCYVFYYTFLQDKAADYKEMAGAIAVLFLHVCFLLRTFWGLAQLAMFYKFSVEFMERWCHLGYSIPVFRLPPDASFANKFSDVTGRWHNEQSSIPNDHIQTPKLTFALTFSAIKCIFERLWRGKQEEYDQERVYDRETIRATVDNCIHVHNLHIDNALIGAELPFRPSMDVNQGFLKCCNPENAIVRWVMSFLSRCGRQWLKHTKNLTSETRSERNYFAGDLLNVALMHVTGPRKIEKPGSLPRIDLTTKLGPLHVLSSVLGSARDTQVQIATKGPIPFMKGQTIDFEEHKYVLADAANWDSWFLRETEPEDREAVRKVTPQQLSCFIKIMQNIDVKSDPNVFRHITKWGSRYEKLQWNVNDLRIEMLQYQVGWDSEEDFSALFDGIPLRKEFFDRFLWAEQGGIFLLQCSVHVDNWIALMSGERVAKYLIESGGSLPLSRSVFNLHRDLELRVLQHWISDSKKKESKWKHINDVRFIGCVMDEVRSFLADWVEKQCGKGSMSNWNTSISASCTRFVCSEQLFEALGSIGTEEDKNKEDKVMSVHMTLLWELQWRVHAMITEQIALGTAEHLPSSHLLMILSVLAFPSVQILCQGSTALQALHGRPVGASESSAHVYTIEAVGGLNMMRVLFTCDDKKNATVQLDESTKQYCNWEEIRDAFRGRLSGQKEWRTTRRFSKKELLLEDSPKSIRVNLVKREDSRVFYKLVCWPGWLPHIPEIARFELSKFVDDEKYFRFADARYSDLKEDIRSVRKALEEMVNSAAAEDIFEEAKECCRRGRLEEASRLYQRCISHHLHYGALLEAKELMSTHPADKGMLDGFLESVDDAFRSAIVQENDNGACSFKKFGLKELGDFLEAVFGETRNEWALVLLSKAHFHQITLDMAFPDMVFELFEAHIEMEKTYGYFSSYLYLALGHLRNSRIYGDDQELQLASRNLDCFRTALDRNDGPKVFCADDLYRFCANWNDWKRLKEIFEKDNLRAVVDGTLD